MDNQQGQLSDNLFVTGIPMGCDEQRVKDIFGQYGTVTSVKVLPPNPSRNDLAALVRMGDTDQAKWLIDNVSGNIPQGLTGPIQIKVANPPGYGWGGGGMMGKGGPGGKGGGWGMGPWGIPYPVMMQMMMKGKGKGKGWSLSDFPAEKKVWIGGLSESVTFRELHAHFANITTPKFAVVMKGKGAGTGGVAFTTAEEAQQAIREYNGTQLGGASIEVDAWTRKAPAPPPAEA